MPRTEITRADIMPMEEYAKVRAARRKEVTAKKRDRRVAVGPYAMFYFESWDTMWHQIHEMLFIEKGGEAQIADELAAYNTLVPQGGELVATVMFEIPDERLRRQILAKLGGVEDAMFLEIAGEKAVGAPEEDVDRTNAEGKASSVQFVHFRLSEAQAKAFRQPGGRILLGIEHPAYGHITVMPEATRAALADDLA